MPLEMKQFTIHFPSQSFSAARITKTVSFNTNVHKAEAVLKGFEAKFINADRDFETLHVDIDVIRISGNDVEVAGDFLLKDRPSPIDPFRGFIQGVVIAVVQ